MVVRIIGRHQEFPIEDDETKEMNSHDSVQDTMILAKYKRQLDCHLVVRYRGFIQDGT